MRNACGLIAESSPSLISGFNHNQFNNPQNFRDEIMENLQKLIDSHQKAELDSQQPGCSSSIFNGTTNNLSNGSRCHGKLLSCFVIGGECRLCFPQMKALCLGDIPTYKIDEMMKNLAIINPHSSEEQLNVLKRNQIVPSYLPKCELITKTNAERLIAMLKLTGSPAPFDLLNNQLRSLLLPLKVAHDCFGGCKGYLYPTLTPNPCLECKTCHNMFKPEDFCLHTHSPTNGKNTCFWGFDATNWPYYIRIDDETTEGDELILFNRNQTLEEEENRLAIFIQTYLARQQQQSIP
uniref:C-SKI SMAD4-binding domain-containing protein n=1 Tax=Meloidogyne floridensis TaxID=298350 RepID=A0A915NIB4_9BILA